MRIVQSIIFVFIFGVNLCLGQCLPGVDTSGFCMTCRSGVTKCDTVVPIGDSSYIAKVNAKWYHVRGDSMYYVFTETPSKYPQSVSAQQYSHYFNLRVGAADRWYDIDSSYKEVRFSRMFVSDFGKSMIGRVASKWTVIRRNGESQTIDCDSVVEATWPYAYVIVKGEPAIVHLQAAHDPITNFIDAIFVGRESVLLRTAGDINDKQWQLVHLPTDRRVILHYDTIEVDVRHMLGTVSKQTVLLDSLGNVLYRSGEGEIILRYNHNRIAVWKRGGEVAFVDYAGRQINTKPLDSVEPGSYGIHLCSEPHDSSICVLDDNGAVIVPSGKYYAVREYGSSHFSFAVLHEITKKGILLVQNAAGGKVLLEITQTGYRELHCDRP